MTPLINDVLALEEQADRVLADARVEAEQLAQRASQDIEKACREIDSETEASLEAQRSAIEQRLAADLAHAEAEKANALAVLERTASEVVPKQADRIVSAFLED